ncbi:MAG: endonuclease MutS2 [Clostridiales bacterium]|nr:endonuclease MutS2 [Clostridiales bacterium]
MSNLLKVLEYNKIIETLTKCAATGLGREICTKLEPSFSFNIVSSYLAETKEAVDMSIKYTAPAFSSIHDIRLALKRAEVSSVLSIEELTNIADTLRGTRALKTYFNNIDEAFPILGDYFNLLYSNISIEDEIYRCIDNSGNISDHASPELRAIRNQIKASETKIKDKISSIIKGQAYSKYLQENIVTIRNDRYVIPVKQEYRANVPGLVHDSSSTGSTLFIEPLAIVEANNKIHELYINEKIEIEKILTKLSGLIWPLTDVLYASLNTIAKLDFCFAKAKFAIDLSAFMPKLNNNGYINLKKARHPLIPKDKVVPIDIYLGKDFSTLVITGPNTGGKTVTLKTVGLISLMAYSGLFIPCNDNSEIAVFDSIFADIGDEQSIEQSLSTFSAHMTNLVQIINNVNSNSLVLVDELGSGTDPVEGSALAMAVLDHLYKVGAKTLASTHYSELKTYALSTEGVKNASCEFNINTLMPTYRLIIGLPGKSNAFAISKKLGLPEDILNTAQSFLSNENVDFENVISNLQKETHKLNKAREKSEKDKKEISLLKGEIIKNKKELEKHKKEIIESAKEEAREILISAQEIAKESIREIKKAKKLKETAMNRNFEDAKEKIKKQLDKTQNIKTDSDDDYVPFDIRVNDTVYIPSLDQEAKILGLPDKNGMVQIQAGVIKTKISINKLRPMTVGENSSHLIRRSATPSHRGEGQGIKISVESKANDIPSELHLLGLRVDEAINILDSYINSALLANLSTIRIVHGKGTGVLKKAVHEYLKNNSHIKSYRIGNFGEGDLGVTIAELK